MQEEISDFLKTGVRRQIFHRIPGKDEFPGLPIDMTESRRGGHDVFQSIRHVFMLEEVAYIVNIDYRINVICPDLTAT